MKEEIVRAQNIAASMEYNPDNNTTLIRQAGKEAKAEDEDEE